jgi:hypothetical protein
VLSYFALVSESSTCGMRTARRMLSRFSLAESGVRAGARPVTPKFQVTVCSPTLPGPVMVEMVSPTALSTLMITSAKRALRSASSMRSCVISTAFCIAR